MKKIIKITSVFLCLFAAMFFIHPMKAMAGGIWAEIKVQYVVLKADGSYDLCGTPAESDYIGVSAELTCPDSSVMNDTIENITTRGYANGIMEYIGEHRFFVASETNVSKMKPGTYKLTKFDCPKGYEYDNALESEFPLSVTITQKDIDDYVAWASTFIGADGKVFPIYVPVKKTGTVSAVLQKPEKVELSIGRNNLYVEPKNYNGKFEVEYQYASKSGGTYKTLKSDDKIGSYIFSQDSCPLKHGKTYYIRARYCKTVAGKKQYGDYGKAIKVKVSKTEVESCKPIVSTKNAGTDLMVKSPVERNYLYRISYSTKKNGKYKEISKNFLSSVSIRMLSQLKAGKTYYVKVRFFEKAGSETIYGPYSKVVKVKR